MVDFNVFSNVHSVTFLSTIFTSVSNSLLLIVTLICREQKTKSQFNIFCTTMLSLLFREDLPIPSQHLLPDNIPENIGADTSQHGEWAGGIMEAVQQHLRHLSLLLSYHQPGKITLSKFAVGNTNFAGIQRMI